jgi:hypothetical protein
MPNGDFYAETGGGAPVISWDATKVGAGFKDAIILPVDVNEPDVSYFTKLSTKQDGTPDFWPLKEGEEEQAAANGESVKRRQKEHAEHTLMTEFRANEMLSDKALERRESDGESDDGVRRWFVKGASASQGIREACKKVGARRGPQVGMYLSVRQSKLEPNNYGGKTRHFEITLREADAASKKVVADYIAAEKAKQPQQEESAYPGMDQDEPPF